MFAKERSVVADATEAVKNNSTALMVVAGIAVVVAVVALAVAVRRG